MAAGLRWFRHAVSWGIGGCPALPGKIRTVAPPDGLGQRRGLPDGGARMLLVTGGAGFIGSNVVASLNEAGRADIAVNDELGTDDKWRNLGKRQLADVVPPGALFDWLGTRKLDAVKQRSGRDHVGELA